MTRDIRTATAQIVSSDCRPPGSADIERDARLKQLQVAADQMYAALNANRIDAKTFDANMNRLERDAAAVKQKAKNAKAAAHFAGSGDSIESWQANGGLPSQSAGVKCKNIGPMDMPAHEMRNMFDALKHRVPYRVEIGTKGFSDGGGLGFKTPGSPVVEGAPYPTGLLPPVLQPGLTQELPYEFDRVADHLPTIAIDAPSIEYLKHTGNVNVPAQVLETGVKGDLGQEWGTATAVPIKIAALSSISSEALADFPEFASWLPRELQRSVINQESNFLANGTGSSGALPGMTGIFQTSSTLTRAFQPGVDETGIDTLIKAINDLRVGAAFAKASLIFIHPSTWSGYLALSKTTTNAYVLGIMNPNEIGTINSLWGVPIVENTMVPEGQAAVLDADRAVRYFVRQGMTVDANPFGDVEWTQNLWSFRCEMRSTLAVLRASAICLVSNLGPGDSS